MNTKDEQRLAQIARDIDGHLIDGCHRLLPVDRIPTSARVIAQSDTSVICSTIGARYLFCRGLGAFLVVPRLTLS